MATPYKATLAEEMPGPLQQPHATMESSLRTLVCHYLDCYMHSNAIFLCERLVACAPREENVLLLATCHVRESSELRAHALLQGCRLPQSRCVVVVVGAVVVVVLVQYVACVLMVPVLP